MKAKKKKKKKSKQNNNVSTSIKSHVSTEEEIRGNSVRNNKTVANRKQDVKI